MAKRPIAERKQYVFGSGKGKWKGVSLILAGPLPADILDSFYS